MGRAEPVPAAGGAPQTTKRLTGKYWHGPKYLYKYIDLRQEIKRRCRMDGQLLLATLRLPFLFLLVALFSFHFEPVQTNPYFVITSLNQWTAAL